MQFNLDMDIGSYAIRAYQPGEINITLPMDLHMKQVSVESRPLEMDTVCGSLVISPRQLIRDWAPQDIATLCAEHLEPIVRLQPEVVLLGTGPRLDFPASEVLAVLHEQQIGVEVMDTAAACRTYNILMAEGRNVVAGLINPGSQGQGSEKLGQNQERILSTE